MFEKVSQAAEKAATSVSRRSFFRGIGKAAVVVAGALTGIAILESETQAKVRYCSRYSIGNCVGKRVGETCAGDVGGVCSSSPIAIDEFGDYICNGCSVKGKPPREK